MEDKYLELEAILQKAADLSGLENPTKDEMDELDSLIVEATGLQAEIEVQEAREQKQADLTAFMAESKGRKSRPDPRGAAREPEPQEELKFKGFGEQMQAVRLAASPGGVIDPRLRTKVSGLSEGVPSDGGFLVQTDSAAELLKRTYETGILASRCRRVPISANANGLKVNAIDETSRATGSRWGGVRAYWLEEGGTKTASDFKLRQMELSLHKLTGLAYATDELLQDTTALESVLMQAFSEEFGFMIDDAIINGTGAGQPEGILNANCLVTISEETGQASTTLVAENVIKMWARMYGKSRMNAAWFINQDIEPQLFTMELPTGTGGLPVYLPPGGLSQSPYGSLFGRPVVPIEHCASLGTIGDIILGDFSQYLLIDKGTMASESSIHVRFIYDETTFRFVYRIDGQATWRSALTPYKGASNTQGPFVVIETR